MRCSLLSEMLQQKVERMETELQINKNKISLIALSALGIPINVEIRTMVDSNLLC